MPLFEIAADMALRCVRRRWWFRGEQWLREVKAKASRLRLQKRRVSDVAVVVVLKREQWCGPEMVVGEEKDSEIGDSVILRGN